MTETFEGYLEDICKKNACLHIFKRYLIRSESLK